MGRVSCAQVPSTPACFPDRPNTLSPLAPRDALRLPQELLGDLFVPPEYLKAQGSFGQGAFATVKSCW